MTVQIYKQPKFGVTAAFTLIEILISCALLGLMTTAFFGALSSGFTIVRFTQEQLRATQILEEKMEIVRLYSWEQVNTPGYVPASFITPYYTLNSNSIGINYTGQVSVSAAPIPEAYSNN